MPVLRFPNFADRTADVRLDKSVEDARDTTVAEVNAALKAASESGPLKGILACSYAAKARGTSLPCSDSWRIGTSASGYDTYRGANVSWS